MNKMGLGPDDINLQTKELHCNYTVLIESLDTASYSNTTILYGSA